MSRYLGLLGVLVFLLTLCLTDDSFAQVLPAFREASPSTTEVSPPPTVSPSPSRVSAYSATRDNNEGTWYIVAKPGAYFPTGKLRNSGFDNSFAGELTMGTYYTRNLALEANVGYFQTEASQTINDTTENDKLWAIPLTVTFKGVLPLDPVELFAGGGIGAYFATLDADGSNAQLGSFSNSGHATALGGHAVVGMNVSTKKFILGVEGRYIFTSSIELLGSKVNLDGFTVTGVLGFRF